MTAFVHVTSPGAFCARANQLSSQKRATCAHVAPRMTANWPDDAGPAYSKYLSNFPMDRLNKAPVITINYYKNFEYDSVSVRLADMAADEGAGDSLKAGIICDDEKAPDVSKWGAYYDPKTVNEAPYINLYASPLPFGKHAISIVQTTVPCSIPTAKAILGDVAPDPALYEAQYKDRLNKAPYIQANYRTNDDDSTVSVETAFAPLNMVAANEILNKYRS